MYFKDRLQVSVLHARQVFAAPWSNLCLATCRPLGPGIWSATWPFLCLAACLLLGPRTWQTWPASNLPPCTFSAENTYQDSSRIFTGDLFFKSIAQPRPALPYSTQDPRLPYPQLRNPRFALPCITPTLSEVTNLNSTSTKCEQPRSMPKDRQTCISIDRFSDTNFTLGLGLSVTQSLLLMMKKY